MYTWLVDDMYRQSLWDTKATQTASAVVNRCCQHGAKFPSVWVCRQYRGRRTASVVWW